MLLGINFSNLTVEGYSSFVLGLLFTIICVASFIYFAKHKNAGKTVAVLTTMVFPFVTIFCWVYLIMNLAKFETLKGMGISLACAAGYLLVALLIGWIVVACAKSKRAEKKVEKTEEVRKAPKKEDVKKQNVPLLAHTEEIKTSAPAEEVKEQNIEDVVVPVEV